MNEEVLMSEFHDLHTAVSFTKVLMGNLSKIASMISLGSWRMTPNFVLLNTIMP